MLYFADHAPELRAFFRCSANELVAGANRRVRTRALAEFLGNSAILGNPGGCSFRGSHQVKWLTHEYKIRSLRARLIHCQFKRKGLRLAMRQGYWTVRGRQEPGKQLRAKAVRRDFKHSSCAGVGRSASPPWPPIPA